MADRHTTARRSLRTTVVWDVLRPALEDRCAEMGRVSLRILDVGGGTGGFAVPLAELGHQVTVVDPSPDALAALGRRVTEAGMSERVVAVQGDVSNLEGLVPIEGVDAILCHGVLEYVDEPHAALTALSSVAGRGAFLSLLAAQRLAPVLSRALAGHFTDALTAFSDPGGRWGPADPVPRRFDQSELVSAVSAADFRVIALHGIRVLADLVPGHLVDAEPRAAAALLALEEAIATHPVLTGIASQLHVLARRV